MCTTCGCSGEGKATVTDLDTGVARPVGVHGHAHAHADRHEHVHAHEPAHGHVHGEAHTHAHEHGATIALEQSILASNDRLAMRNRGWLEGRNTLALNLVSSPGAGKTTLLERTIRDLGDELPISVVEGDQETVFDAERIRATGCRTVQVNTGAGCHLDAEMLARALHDLAPPLDSVVMIENVGNLVCPALFDLGEWAKVAILSVTEGDDKPMKYPHMFRASRLMVLNKMDLLRYVDFDVERCIGYARRVNPEIEVLTLSARSGEGMEGWYRWLRARVNSGDFAENAP